MMIIFEAQFMKNVINTEAGLKKTLLTNPKTAWGRATLTPSPCGFSKNAFSKERVKPQFFVNFNIILKYIFPENFIEFPQVVQKT